MIYFDNAAEIRMPNCVNEMTADTTMKPMMKSHISSLPASPIHVITLPMVCQ